MVPEAQDTTRLVRVLLVPPSGDLETHAIEPKIEDVRDLIGAPVMALPFDLAGRLVLYVAEEGAKEANPRATQAFGGQLSGPVVLVGLRDVGGLTDLSDADFNVWWERLLLHA